MKRYLIVLLYTFVFLLSNFAIIKTDIYAENTSVKELVENKLNYNTVRKLKKEQEEIESENSTIVHASITNEDISNNSLITANESNETGAFGRLYILDYSVTLYDYNVNTNSSSSLQTIVNNIDSAAYYLNKNKLIIADHNYQGFNILTNLTEGMTSYIISEDGSVIEYKLIKKAKGFNIGQDLIDTEGNSFFNMKSDIIMYTCYDDGIMTTLWTLL